jgi:hypothetical protein
MARITIATLFALFSVMPRLAHGQETGFVRGLGGVMVDGRTGSVLAGGAGLSLGRGLQVIGELGRAGDLMPDALEEHLGRAALELLPGHAVTSTAALGITYTYGGARVLLPGRSRIFVEGGVGTAWLDADLHVLANGLDVSQFATSELIDFDPEPLVMVGAGVDLPITRRVGVEFGLRHLRVVTGSSYSVRMTNATAAIRMGF